MIGNLKLEAPHIWKLIRDQLIGNGGTPDGAGDAAGGIVRDAEKRYKAEKGDYWYRFWRADDPMVYTGGVAYTYSATYSTAAEEDLLALDNPITVSNAEAILSLGWYCELDLDQKGYLKIQKEGVVKSSIPARVVWRQQHPEHFYIDLDCVIKAWEGARVHYKIFNGFGHDMIGVVIPLLFRIASRSILNLEKSRTR